MYAEIAVNAPIQSTFHYHIPPELEDVLRPGHLVRVGFGTAVQHGIVLAFHKTSPIEETKPVEEILDPQPVLTAQQLELAHWMSETTLAPIGTCLWLMLPPGLTARDFQVTLLDKAATSGDSLEQSILDVLRERGALRGQQLNVVLKKRAKATQQAVNQLVKAGVIKRESVLAPPKVRPKTIRTATLAIHPDQIPHVARHLGRTSRRADLLEVVAARSEDEWALVSEVLHLAEASRATLNRLAEDGYVTIEKGEGRDPDMVLLEIPAESVSAALIELRGGDKQLHVLEFLAHEAIPVDARQLCEATESTLNDLKALAEAGLILLGEEPVWRDSLADRDFVPTLAPRLTPEQQTAWETIEAVMKQWAWDSHPAESTGCFLLHGVTGSGKTEIYLHAIEHTLAQGRQAIFLVPEIALTAQTVRRVASRFPGQVALVHGSLSPGERYDTWRRAREGLIQVVVGARSALFTPFPDVGLVILDEEHDHSYKQSPSIPPPYYHARQVAETMMHANNGVLILGSATPDVETMYRAQRGDLGYLHLPQRIMGHRTRIQSQAERTGVITRYIASETEDALTIDLPPVTVVDMREELKAGNVSMFSNALQSALETVLERREQAILFLNRRGQSTYVFCRDCGTIEKCPRCDTPLTYHRQGEKLRCHHCGYQKAPATQCPECGSRRIKFFGAGTQQVEAALQQAFPQARLLRWDADTAQNPAMHEAILQQFIDRQADVMIGTQMIAKGLDLPLVTLVGVISADLELALPDFRAGERTFQLLTQVAGRAGRGLLGGQVVLQTYKPDHYAIAAAAEHDYTRFYATEIAYRKRLGYPPFRRMARLLFQYTDANQTRREAERVVNMLRERIAELKMTGTEIIGPTPCFFSRLDRHYRWQVLLRGPNPTAALVDMPIARGWYLDIDPLDIL